MTAQVHAMYPWATQIATADGAMKNKYNLAQGTTLQPLQTHVRALLLVNKPVSSRRPAAR